MDRLDDWLTTEPDYDEPEIKTFFVIVDGMPWVDTEGNDQFYESEAERIAEQCERKEYEDVRVVGTSD